MHKVVVDAKNSCIKCTSQTNAVHTADVSPLVQNDNTITAITTSNDGRRLVVGTNKGTIASWASNEKNELLPVGALRAHAHKINAVKTSLSGNHVLTCSTDCTACVIPSGIVSEIDSDAAKKRVVRLRGHRMAIMDGTFMNNDTAVVVVGLDGLLTVHCARTGDVQRSVNVGTPLISVALTRDMLQCYCCSYTRVFCVDLAAACRPSLDNTRSATFQNIFTTNVENATVTPCVQELKFGDGDYELLPNDTKLSRVAASDDGNNIFAVTEDGRAAKWQVGTSTMPTEDGLKEATAELLSSTDHFVSYPLHGLDAVAEEESPSVATLGWDTWYCPAVALKADVKDHFASLNKTALKEIEIDLEDDSTVAKKHVAAKKQVSFSGDKRKRPATAEEAKLEELVAKQKRLQAVCDELFSKLEDKE